MIKILIVVWVALMAFCIWGLIQSLKNEKTKKKMQQAADLSYKTKNGKYSFNYMVKGFDNEGGKLIKILIDPVLGFSDLPYADTNTCVNAFVTVKNKIDYSLVNNFSFNYDERSLKPDIKFVINDNFKNNSLYDLEICVETTWILGPNQINEKIIFDYKG